MLYQHTYSPTVLNLPFPGSGTCMVPLPGNSAGKQLHIQFTRLVPEDTGPLALTQLIEGTPTPQNRAPDNPFIFALMVSLLYVGFFLLLVALFYRTMNLHLASLLYLALTLISLSFWTLCNSKMIELFNTNWVSLHNLEYISFYALPFAMLAFIATNWDGPTKTLRGMAYIMFAFFVLSLVLRCFFYIDFFQLLSVFHVLVVATLAVIIRELFLRMLTTRSASFFCFCIGSLLLGITVVLELVRYYAFYSPNSVAEIFILGLAAFCFMLILSLLLSSKERADRSFAFLTQRNLDAEHQRYELLVHHTRDVLLDWDMLQDTVYFSKQFEPFFGVPPFTHDMVKHARRLLRTVSHNGNAEEIYRKLRQGVESQTLEGCFVHPRTGEKNWFELTLTPIANEKHVVVRTTGIIRDITKEKMLQEEYAQQHEHIQLNSELFDNILEADITEDKLLGQNSEALRQTLGLKPDTTYSETVQAVTQQLTHPDFAQEYARALSRSRILTLFETGVPAFEYECLERTENMHYSWIRLRVRIFKSDLTGTVRIVSYVKNIDEEKKQQMALLSRSMTDSLSGLLNKGATRQRVNETLANYSSQNHAFLMIDTDHFKEINDTLGHAAGDLVLQHLAAQLKSHFRETDVVGRVGGDEFAVLVRNISSIDALHQLCRTLCENLQDTHCHQGACCTVSISMGVALYPQHGATYEELYKNADDALYASKENGRNRYTFFTRALVR